jgi:gliding motility-associated-like protein
MKKILNFLFLVCTPAVLAQPANNTCAGAVSITPNGSCIAGTTSGATDSWAGSIGCAGNNGEVWYTFIATGSQLTATVTSGTMGGNPEFILIEATGVCTGFSLAGSFCAASTGTINGLQVGTRYYINISNTGTGGTFTLCANNATPPPVSGQDCSTAAILCSAASFTQSSSSAGFGTQEVNAANSCWGSGGERQSKWFKFTVGCSGTLEFNINPVVSSDDYDWSLWNVTTLGCPTTASATQTEVACNWSGCKGSTGITSCASAIGEPGRVTSGSGCGGNPAAWNIQTLNVTAGNTYALLIDNFSSSNNGFSLTFGGACNGGTAIIGPDAAFTYTSPSCGVFNFTKSCQTSNSTYLWTFGDGTTSTLQNPTKTYSVSGTFLISLTVTDALGCQETSSQTVAVGIPTSNAGPDLTLCSVATGTLGTATTAGYSYSWTPSTGLSSQTVSNPSFTLTNNSSAPVSQIYTVTTTAGGCSSTDAVTVTVNPTPTVSVNSPSICAGNAAILTASTANSYSWSTGATTNTISVTPTVTTNYTVTGTTNGCSVTRIATVTVNSIPTTTASTSGTITCSTPSVTLNSTLAGMNYTWTAPTGGIVSSPNSQSTSASGAAGNYTLFVSNAAGCTYSTTTSVTQNTTAPTGVSAGSNQTLTCLSPSVTLTGVVVSPLNATLNWTGANVCGSPTTAITSACGAGVYTLTATNPANGCTASATVQVFPSAGAPTVSNNPVTNSITCTNTLVTVSITTTDTPVSYAWSGTGIVGATNTATIIVNQGGTFQYTVTNLSNGCTTSNNQVVPQNTTIPTTTATTTGTINCFTPTVTLNSTLSGMNYTWTPPSGGSVGSANSQSTTASGAAGTYSLFVLDAINGCTFATTTSVSQNTVVPTTTASTNGTLTCITNTVTLNSSLSGMNYTWTPPSGGSVGSANSQSTTASGAAGTYSLLVVNPVNGCSFTTTTSVTQNTAVPVTVASTTGTLTCTTLTVALNSTLAGMNYTWTAPAGGSVASANSQSTTASGAAGTYSLLVVNPSSGCTFTTTTSVTQNTTVPVTSASTTGTLTCSSLTVALSSTLSGMNYTWTAPSGGSVGSANTQTTSASGAGGTYSLLVVNPSTGCTFATTTTVTQNTIVPSSTASTSGTLTCSANTVALVSTLGGMNYTWTAPAGGTVGSANTQTTTASGVAGAYSLTIMDPSNGCSSMATTAVTQNTTVPVTVASTSGTLTCIASTVALNSTLAGMNYTWSAPAGGTVGTAYTQSTTASGAAGTYTLLVQNPANGCTFETTTSVTQDITAPTGVNAGPNQTLGCGSGTVITLNGSAATPTNAIASWAGPSVSGSSSSFTTTANGAGIYTLTATNPDNGCFATSTVEVFPNAGAPSLTIDPITNTITCTNTLVTVSISTTVSPVSFNWSGTGIVSGNGTGTITVSQGGTYNFTLTNTTNSCTASGNTVVVQNTSVPTTSAGTTGTLTCSSMSVNLSSTLGGMNYTWTAPAGGTLSSPNTQSTTASGAPGTYSLVVEDPSNGCTFATTTAVSQNTIIPTTTASSNGTLTCVTTTVSLTSSLAGMDYTWTAPSGGSVSTLTTQSTVASGSPGDYTLTVLDPSNGCTFTTTANVPQDITTPTLTAGNNQTLTCNSPTVTLTGSVSSPTNAVVDWGTSVCGTQTTVVTEACAAGIYTLTATDPSNGCIATSTVEVFPNAGAPTVTLSASTLTIDCNNATQSVTVTSTPNTDVTYSWSPAPSSVSASGDVATFSNANTYICTVTNTVTNCSTPVQVVVSDDFTPPAIQISPTQTITCTNPTAVISVTATGTYSWTGSGAIVSGQGTSSITVNTGGDYSVVVTAANGCSATASSHIDADQNIPTVTISASSTNSMITCSNPTVTLTASVSPAATYSYTWAPSGNTGSANESVTGPGLYNVIVLNSATGCTATAVQQFTVIGSTTPPSVSASNTVMPCGSPSVAISANATNVSYNWTTTNGTILSGGGLSTAVAGSTGQYVVTVTDNTNGCTNSATVSVTSIALTAAFTADPVSGTAPLLVNFTNQTSGTGNVYTWNFGDDNNNSSTLTNPNHTYTTSGTYTVLLTVTDASGLCSSTASVTIEVFDNFSIIVPNVFTPNGDGANDLFRITTTGVEELNCDIFNRWGLKVYTIKSASDFWDGGGNNAGTYFFILNAKGFDGVEHKQEGFISLFK